MDFPLTNYSLLDVTRTQMIKKEDCGIKPLYRGDEFFEGRCKSKARYGAMLQQQRQKDSKSPVPPTVPRLGLSRVLKGSSGVEGGTSGSCTVRGWQEGDWGREMRAYQQSARGLDQVPPGTSRLLPREANSLADTQQQLSLPLIQGRTAREGAEGGNYKRQKTSLMRFADAEVRDRRLKDMPRKKTIVRLRGWHAGIFHRDTANQPIRPRVPPKVGFAVGTNSG